MTQILRFRKSERLLHWAIAVPFLVCYVTAIVLVAGYNPDPQRPYRQVFAAVHRVSGVAFILLPILAVVKSKGDWRIHFQNIRQAWLWTLQDVRWLAMMGLAAMSPRFRLPEQGKFNAAEKINFMTLLGTYPLYIATGLLIWLTHGAFLAWVVHFAMAVVATPLILGHIFMATVNPETRVGLSGMISGFVDRQWARHHYAHWYREHYGELERGPALPAALEEVLSERPGTAAREEKHHGAAVAAESAPVASAEEPSLPIRA